MILANFKSNHPALTIQLILLAVLLWIDGFVFFREINVNYQDHSLLYSFVNQFSISFPFLSVVTAFIFLLAQTYFFNRIITDNNLTDRTSYLPALIYLVFMSSSFGLLGLNPVAIANFFILIIIYKIFNLITTQNPSVAIFNIGFLISITSLFYLPAFWFIFILILSLITYYMFNFRSFLAALTGFFIPYLFVALYLYWIDMLSEKFKEFINVFQPVDLFAIDLTGFEKVAILIFAIITILVLLYIYFINMQSNPVRIQKRFQILLIFLFVFAATTLFSGDYFHIHYGLVMLPLAALFAAFFQQKGRAFWNEMIFTIIIILILVGKLVRHA